MANIYVRSTDGSDADNGSTWALAKATLAGAAAIDSAGDRIYVSQSHAESSGSSQSVALAGTQASPVWVVGANDAAEPPTAVSSAPTLTTTGNSGWSFSGYGYLYGLYFTSGSGGSGSAASINFNGPNQVAENCTFEIGVTSTSPRIYCSGDSANANSSCEWKNCNVKFGNSSQAVSPRRGFFKWSGGAVIGSTFPTTLITPSGTSNNYAGKADVSGIDMSAASSSMNLFDGTQAGKYTIRNCRLPGSWSGSLAAGTIVQGFRAEMHNCDSADTNYRIWTVDFTGSVKSETTIVRTGGANDATTNLSWMMSTSADAEYPGQVLFSPDIVQWNETTGSSLTATVEVVTDGVTLTDAECWLEIQYLGTSGYPLGTYVDDSAASVLATPANQTSSTETWTTTGLTSPVKQKLSVSFTPQEKGFIHAVVKVAKASTTVYVDPKLTVA